MKWLAIALCGGLIAGGTAGAAYASFKGIGLPGMFAEPISVKHDSTTRRGRSSFIYFGRSYRGGGPGYGK